MCKGDGAAAPPAANIAEWQILRCEKVPDVGQFVHCDKAASADLPGGFLMVKAKGSSDRFESFTSVTPPGGKTCLFVSAIRRVRPSLQKALDESGELEVRESGGPTNTPFGFSHTLSDTKRSPCFVQAAGRLPLTLTPFASVLRWKIPETHQIPKLYWAVHSREEVTYLTDILKNSPSTAPKGGNGGRYAEVMMVLCGHRNCYPEVEEAVEELRSLLPGDVMSVREPQGLDMVPTRIFRDLKARGVADAALETLSHQELHYEIRRRMEAIQKQDTAGAEVKFDFSKPPSFGWLAPKRNDWVDFEPWPVSSSVPPLCLMPVALGKSKLPMQDWLFLETDPLPLALFRIAFGFLTCQYGVEAITTGRAFRDHEWSGIRFKYDFFEHLGPDLAPPYCYYMYYAMAAAGFGLMIGWPYRLSSLVFTITFAWHFFSEATHYNNHYYLMICLGFLFTITNADATLKFQPLRFARWLWSCIPSRGKAAETPEGGGGGVAPLLPCTEPVQGIAYINHYLLRSLVLFVYFYGFVAKLNNDWVSGHVMRSGMQGEQPPWILQELCVFFLSWGGLVFDLVGPLYLCYNPLRVPALIGFVFFNVSNMFMFNIGCFPWMCLGSIALLVETHTCRDKLRSFLWDWAHTSSTLTWWGRLSWVETAVRGILRWTGRRFYPLFSAYKDSVFQLYRHEVYYSMPNGNLRPPVPAPMKSYSTVYRYVVSFVFFVVVVLELTVPLRNWHYHWGTDQTVAWTEHGRKFSWHMMSRHKYCGGNATIIHEASNTKFNISLYPGTYNGPIQLNQHQLKKLGTIATYVRQLSWGLRRHYEKFGALAHGDDQVDRADRPEDIRDHQKAYRVHTDVWCEGNGAPMQPFIDYSYDLSREVPPVPKWKREEYIITQKVFGNPGYPNVYPYKTYQLTVYKTLKSLLFPENNSNSGSSGGSGSTCGCGKSHDSDAAPEGEL
eukprot:TRINITY_DN23065_c0_g1_i1.p1 TRINITY_DN23065_c0_g1~~TRINITY_DN23065_c0_g1_i1.p1  ORF type:complete len:950 (+),score=362.35 TRINITY_DN23065_c0_g1_i1:95-2944(+)